MESKFLEKYLNDLSSLIRPDKKNINMLIDIKNSILTAKETKNKIMIFGNGGSAAIASHFSVDMTKNAGVRCTNYNESDLITCFANDYGFERWVEKAVDFYGNSGDLLITISSSGQSKNMINGCDAAFRKKFSKVITFSGFDHNNPLRSKGDINLWVDSKAYNYVENIHQIWLLSIVDLIIGNKEYSA